MMIFEKIFKKLVKMSANILCESNQDLLCPICNEEYQKINQKEIDICITSCQHKFHLSCMLKWNKDCSICRNILKYEIDENSTVEENVDYEDFILSNNIDSLYNQIKTLKEKVKSSSISSEQYIEESYDLFFNSVTTSLRSFSPQSQQGFNDYLTQILEHYLNNNDEMDEPFKNLDEVIQLDHSDYTSELYINFINLILRFHIEISNFSH